MPYFSVIIPTYNRAEFLKIAVESVLEQDFDDFELLVIDDGSTDNTKQIIENINNPKIRYFYQQNQGPSSARNLGIKQAKGEWLCFLDSDDRFRKNKLSTAYEYIKKYPEYKIFHTEEIWYKNGKFLSPKKTHKKPNGYVFENALKICCISLSTAIIHKNVFKKIGLFDENFPACEDYEFWLRATFAYPVKLIPRYLTIKEGGRPDQQSKAVSALDKYRYKAIKKLISTQKLSPEKLKICLYYLEEKANIYIKGLLKRNKEKAEIFRQGKNAFLKEISQKWTKQKK
ncbi:MAG: glycosyltransferase family 2 protein [Candidatus Aenigmatarchaeota archaeon]|nr:MAG: glycosyltransferase family 2 protein [Candidatus Aenigmarchaeota archaeon]